ncbi:MAG: tryptophan-rich sensory protein [Dehalococcoidales bacterium]|nr:tryptophan-rich sensory protein [Dehalococcoidales bacterium]
MNCGNVIKLIVSIVATFAAGGIGSLFTFKAVPTWYQKLRKPPYTPPNRLFGPVWTILYILMGISVFLVWREGLATSSVMIAFILFWVQLVFNALWSVVFFGVKSKGGGIIIIIVLWILIMITIINSFRVSVWAGSLLIPYIVWVSIAAYLNIGIWALNKSNISATDTK